MGLKGEKPPQERSKSGSQHVTLDVLGLQRMQAHRWHKLAGVRRQWRCLDPPTRRRGGDSLRPVGDDTTEAATPHPPRLALAHAAVTAVSLEVDAGITFERWSEVGRRLGQITSGVSWWVADWWAFGERKYGERAALRDDRGRIHGFKYESLMTYGSVARAFPETSNRFEALTFKHHLVVAALDDRQAWLKQAEEHGWSSGRLRIEAQRGQRAAQRKRLAAGVEAAGDCGVITGDFRDIA
ncbi:MAG: hypothetical protein IH830_03900 [Planctomycetes bacterium]|nr:hypothetical protein [Planctomycetota bacterium]